MRYKFTKAEIPEKVKTKEFFKNAWIAPNGTFYGFDGAKHLYFASWIAIFVEGADENSLKKGVYFNQTWDGWLHKKGYIEVKDTTWLDSSSGGVEVFGGPFTQKQRDVLFDYSEYFKIDYKKLVEGKLKFGDLTDEEMEML